MSVFMRFATVKHNGVFVFPKNVLKYSTPSNYHIPCREDDYHETPKYPPIYSIDKKSLKRRSLEEWYDKIKRQNTIEEKLFEVNVPRFWGWKSLILKEGEIPFNNLPFVQHITRTHLCESKELPELYKNYSEKSLEISNAVKEDIEDALLYQLDCVRHRYQRLKLSPVEEENEVTSIVVTTLNRVLMKHLLKNTDHVEDLHIDHKPRTEAFWSVGGMEVPPEKIRDRELDEDKDEEDRKAPMDRWCQYLGSPILQVRHHLPLPQLVEQSSAVVSQYPVQTFSLDPAVIGYKTERRHGTNIPGFWPGDEREFAFMSYHSSCNANHRPESYGSEDYVEALQCQAILASYSWLLSLACYQGFSPFHDPTYPTTTQTVLTDGKNFTLAAYQLNTTVMYEEKTETNPHCNLCWVMPTMKLYEGISNGKLEGFNSEVLAKLIQLYLNQPAEREGVNLKPYLGKDVKKIADIDEDERRIWLENQFKHFSSNRPRHRIDKYYEVYDWERIYKIDHKTRPADPRRRPFELKQKPFHVKMSDIPGKYIPRCLRPDADIPKWRQKKRRTNFYPK